MISHSKECGSKNSIAIKELTNRQITYIAIPSSSLEIFWS
uniref:Bm14477 n=1 Tax=Brugia malayi TaxID=6279 RepID=A0A1I9G4F8_BRUMA|nr:Bm14477 [Brugia malayi]